MCVQLLPGLQVTFILVDRAGLLSYCKLFGRQSYLCHIASNGHRLVTALAIGSSNTLRIGDVLSDGGAAIAAVWSGSSDHFSDGCRSSLLHYSSLSNCHRVVLMVEGGDNSLCRTVGPNTVTHVNRLRQNGGGTGIWDGDSLSDSTCAGFASSCDSDGSKVKHRSSAVNFRLRDSRLDADVGCDAHDGSLGGTL